MAATSLREVASASSASSARDDVGVDVRDEGDDSSRKAMDIESRAYDTSIGRVRNRGVALLRALHRALDRVVGDAMRGAPRAPVVDCRFTLPRQKRKSVEYRDE